MQRKEFLDTVNRKLEHMTEDDKTDLLCTLARLTEESAREAFLSLMREEQILSATLEELDNISQWCRQLAGREIFFEKKVFDGEFDDYEDMDEEEWDDLSNSDVYTDDHGIGLTLMAALDTAERLMYQKEYAAADQLYDTLDALDFPMLDTDAGEFEVLDLRGISLWELAEIRLDRIALNRMYLKYQTLKGDERNRALYRLLKEFLDGNFYNSGSQVVTISALLDQIGPEPLKDYHSFLDEWVNWLKEEEDNFAGTLLSSGGMETGGMEFLSETAPEVALIHPGLYHHVLQHYFREKQYQLCEEVGLEALRLIPDNFILRGSVAELTAAAASCLSHKEIEREARIQAFFSESSAEHFLALFGLGQHEELTKTAAEHARMLSEMSFPESRYGRGRRRERDENRITQETLYSIRFFNGEFSQITDELKEDDTGLGWTTHFKGIAVPFFLVALSREMSLTAAAERLLDPLTLRLGFKRQERGEFFRLFQEWKAKLKIPEQEAEAYLLWLEKETALRTEAVVGGGYRDSYHKAAELIIALGEALESRGIKDGCQKLIAEYSRKYSRKTAFKRELKAIAEYRHPADR